jgi:hypothetical protein
VTLDPDEIVKNWKRLVLDFVRCAQRHPISGTDLLALPGWRGQEARALGPNVRIRKGGSILLDALPDLMQGCSFTLRAHVLVLEGEGARVQLRSEEGPWLPTFRKNEWTLATGTREELHVPGRRGEWTEIVFDVKDTGSPRRRYERIIRITVDGTVLLDSGRQNGRYSDFGFGAGDGTLIVGGVSLKW